MNGTADDARSKNWLPRPPVPSLDRTLNRYLEYAKVVASNQAAAIARTKSAVNEFRIVGTSLQAKLENLANEKDNWINQFWLPEMYLRVRLPLPVNSNPFYSFPALKFANISDQLSYTSWLIRGICEYKDRIDRRLIEVELSSGMSKVHLCMWQYDRLLGCYREPCFNEDIQHTKPRGRHLGLHWNEHILVMSNNQTFILFTRLCGKLVPQREIVWQLEEIVRMSDNKPKDMIIPVSGGSVGNRDVAAEFWKLMKQTPKNVNSLDLVKKSLFAVCIDRPNEAIKLNNVSELNIANRGLHLLHGFGPKNCGLNRWYDATIQLIVSSDGTNGLCIEHSAAEGIVIVNMGEFAIDYAVKHYKQAAINQNDKVSEIRPRIIPKPLEWTIYDQAQQNIAGQLKEFDELVNDLQLVVVIFTDFGKEFIKLRQISPDGFVQLSMQLAYYRFCYGRVDNIRAATPEALQWVEAMMDGNSLMEVKQQRFQTAVQKQALITQENVTGHGIDNHLCALRVLAAEEVKNARLDKMPDIFEDPIWNETMRFPLSTSQVTTKLTFPDTALGYGPVVKDGYGCSYNIQPNRIAFSASAFKSCSKTNLYSFKEALVDSLRDMRALLH